MCVLCLGFITGSNFMPKIKLLKAENWSFTIFYCKCNFFLSYYCPKMHTVVYRDITDLWTMQFVPQQFSSHVDGTIVKYIHHSVKYNFTAAVAFQSNNFLTLDVELQWNEKRLASCLLLWSAMINLLTAVSFAFTEWIPVDCDFGYFQWCNWKTVITNLVSMCCLCFDLQLQSLFVCQAQHDMTCIQSDGAVGKVRLQSGDSTCNKSWFYKSYLLK